MPNHCSNDLRISGKPEYIADFFIAVKGDEKLIDENKIIPYPKKFAEADARAEEARKRTGDLFTDVKDGYNNGGYDWCVKHWGTKWGLYEFSEIKHFKTSAVVSFQTAWSPPSPIILQASKMFPKLKFTLRWYECGVGAKGVQECKGGVILRDESSDYSGNRGG